MQGQARPSTLDVLTIEQCAERLNCDVATVWRHRKNKGLPYVKIGRRIYFRAASVDKWLAEQERVDAAPTAAPPVRRRGRINL